MRSDILQKYPNSQVRVYVIWFDMLPGDSRQLVDTRVLNDSRVMNYYDPKRIVGTWFAEQSGEQGIEWDAFFLYGPGASWTAQLGPLFSSGSSVIGSSGDLASAFDKLSR